METEAPNRGVRPKPWLLALLALALVGLVANRMWPDQAAATDTPASNPRNGPKPDTRRSGIDPAELDVNLEALSVKRAEAGNGGRDPFRFQPRAVPAPPKSAGGPPPPPFPPPMPPGPPPVPPITLKFMGTVEKGTLTLAALTDCKGFTYSGREGEEIDGRYRLVKIGVESVVMEYINGTGRMTIRKSGDCPPR
jgi:hypothetical protein